MRGLANEVGIEEDRQAQSAGAYVTDREGNPAWERLLDTELRFVGRLLGIEGRKITTEGRLWAGDVMTAEARALFISFDMARFNQMIDARRSRFPLD